MPMWAWKIQYSPVESSQKNEDIFKAAHAQEVRVTCQELFRCVHCCLTRQQRRNICVRKSFFFFVAKLFIAWKNRSET